MKKTISIVMATVILSACSSIKSIESPIETSDSANGLTYFMPKKDFLVTVSVKAGEVEKVSLGTTSAYADLSKQYVLRHGGNLFGKNTLDVGVSEAGLLTSTKSTTESNVSEAVKGLATIAGQLKAFSLTIPPAFIDPVCKTTGDHTFVYPKSGTYTPCGMTVTIKKQTEESGVVSHSKKAEEEYSGIFYRQSIPYLVTAEGNGLNVAAVVFSPSESKTHFLSVSRTFFSNNDADFTFVDGVPTKYKQETNGEVVALVKLPADIIGAYFTAIGSVFDSFTSTDTKEAAAIQESLKLELAKKKYDMCIAAIKAGDDALIKDLGCQ